MPPIRYSVLIPVCRAAAAVIEQLAALRSTMERLGEPYEVICIDDASASESFAELQANAQGNPALRLLRLERPAGASSAVAAGISAARGEILIALDPVQTRCEQIPLLLKRLSRADAVFGKRETIGFAKWRQRFVRIPRGLLLGLEVRDPECLFWAARREAVADFEPARGMLRYLSSLIAMRGFRVTEVGVQSAPVDSSANRRNPIDGWPNPGDLLNIWWRRRRYRACEAREVAAVELGQSTLRLVRPDDSLDSDRAFPTATRHSA